MTALEPVLDGDELFLDRFDDLEWIDDVTKYQCTRCSKVLVQHYIANCQHKFCDNCKRVVDDGSQKWKCPKCKEYIKDIGGQDPHFKNKVGNLRLYCPNHKYGCQHSCSFKEVKEHFKGCKHTKERALPVLYKGQLTCEMLDRMFTLEMLKLRKEIKEIKQKAPEWENKQNDKDADENTWELSVEMGKLKKAMAQMEKRQNDDEKELIVRASIINSRMDGVESDLNVEITRLKNQVSDNLQKQIKSTSESISTAMEDNKSRILKLEGKSESYLEMIDFHNKRNNQKLKKEFEMELKSKSAEMKSELEKLIERTLKRRKWEVDRAEEMWTNRVLEEKEELKAIASQNASQILDLNKRIKKLDRDFEDLRKLILSNTRKNQKPELLSSLTIAETDPFQIINKYYEQTPDFTWLVTGITSFLHESEKPELLSEVFPLRGYPFGARGRLRLYAEEVWFDLSYKDITKTDKPAAKIPQLIPNIFVTLKDRSRNAERKDIINVYCFPYGKQLKYDTFYDFYLSNVQRKIFNSPSLYMLDDEVELKIHVEAPEVAQLVHSDDGKLSWAINDFRRLKQMEVDGLIKSVLSPYFYTSRTGYRVHVEAYLNGYDTYENKGLSLKINFLTGLYDEKNDSKSNFRGKATLDIFHNLHSSRNINKTVEVESENCTMINVGTHEQIDELLRNDTLNCRVTID